VLALILMFGRNPRFGGVCSGVLMWRCTSFLLDVLPIYGVFCLLFFYLAGGFCSSYT